MHLRFEHLLFPLALAGVLAACDDTRVPTNPAAEEAAPAPAASAAAVPTAPDTWAARATIDSNGIFFGGFTAGAAKNAAGQWTVYAFGGINEDNGSGWPVHAYDMATDTWTTRQTLVWLSDRWNGVGLIGNILYYSGGSVYDETGGGLWGYDFAADRQVTPAQPPRLTADGVTGVYHHKILYVLPGTCSGDGWPYPGYCDSGPFHRLYRYDPATDKWGTRAQSLYYHRGGAGAVVNNKFYVVGGQDATGTYRNTWRLEAYDPATNHWTARKSMPSGGTTISDCIRGTPCLFAAVLQQKLWVLTRDHRLQVYDPANNTWTRKARLPAATRPEAMVRVAIGAQAYLFVVGTGPTPSQLYRP